MRCNLSRLFLGLTILIIFVIITDARKFNKPNPNRGVSEKKGEILPTIIEVGGLSYIITEGDIMVLAEESRNAISHDKRWPSGVIPYEFHVNLTTAEKELIGKAMRGIEAKTCIKFHDGIENTPNYVTIILENGDVDFTPIGMDGGQQHVIIGKKAEDFQHITHALVHTIGFYHENNREDRDAFIKVLQENINFESRLNFEMRKNTTNVGSYDRWSIMHGKHDLFALRNKSSMVSKEEFYVLGSSTDPIGITCMDAHKINQLYCEEESHALLNECDDCVNKLKTCAVHNRDDDFNMRSCGGKMLHEYCTRNQVPVSAISCEAMWDDYLAKTLCNGTTMKSKNLIFLIRANGNEETRKIFLESVAKTVAAMRRERLNKVGIIEFREHFAVTVVVHSDNTMNRAKLYNKIVQLGMDPAASMDTSDITGLHTALTRAEEMIPGVKTIVIMTMNHITKGELEGEVKQYAEELRLKGAEFVWFATLNGYAKEMAKTVFPNMTENCIKAYDVNTLEDFIEAPKFRLEQLCMESNSTCLI